jgi:hypothetical protein
MKKVLILCCIISIGLNCVQKSALNEPVSKEKLAKQIYFLDDEDHKREKEITKLRNKAYEAERDKHFKEANDLKEKADKSEGELKDYKVKLEESLKEYEIFDENQPWWQHIVLEGGPCYIHFDNQLKLADTWGSMFRLHWVNYDFRRFHLGSYLYYPLEASENYPLHQVEASPFILEYRYFKPTLASSKITEATMNSYRLGFGVLSQAWNRTYLKLNLLAGYEKYDIVKQTRDGPVVCYALGLAQKLSRYLNIGVEISESAFWSQKNEGKNKLLLNPSAAVSLRISF